MGKSIFITGTGTDVGKTFITALIVKKLHEAGKKAAYFKAAASGNVRSEKGLIPGDADMVDRKSTRLNSSHSGESRMPSSA